MTERGNSEKQFDEWTQITRAEPLGQLWLPYDGVQKLVISNNYRQDDDVLCLEYM